MLGDGQLVFVGFEVDDDACQLEAEAGFAFGG